MIRLLVEEIEVANRHPVGMRGKPSIRCNVWGNWWGYIGRNRVYEIGASGFDAECWLKEQREIQGVK
tara:strand:- start:923 stop:1123 length:201 start_codon:yes stop_codon:yes gene_type:complete